MGVAIGIGTELVTTVDPQPSHIIHCTHIHTYIAALGLEVEWLEAQSSGEHLLGFREPASVEVEGAQ